MENPINFDDLDDTTLVSTGKTYRELNRVADQVPVADDITMGTGKAIANVARYKCGKCHGSGKFYGYTGRLLGDCRGCGGTGLVKTNPEIARKRKEAAQKREADAAAAKVAAWTEAHPVAAAWITSRAPRMNFAKEMLAKLGQWGSLTDGQLAAVERMAAEDAKRDAERAQPRKADAEVGGAGFQRMLDAFQTAITSGLKRLKFRVGEYAFTLPKPDSPNAGCLYVKRGDTYLGKITATGGYFASRDASDADKAEVARIGADPLAAAVMHGKETGVCSCCGRELENEESVAAGIGPICARKWGLA